MNFKTGEKLGIYIPGVLLLLLGSFLITNIGEAPQRKPIPEILPAEPSPEENIEQTAVFVYRGERETPPNPFLREQGKIKGNLPRPVDLEVRGIIRGREEFLAIIEVKEEIFLVRKGDGFSGWEIERIFSDHIILRKIPERAFYYLPIGGD